jgi:hypothetical protein
VVETGCAGVELLNLGRMRPSNQTNVCDQWFAIQGYERGDKSLNKKGLATPRGLRNSV